MSTTLSTNDGIKGGNATTLNAVDRADVTITLHKEGQTDRIIGIAKTFSFNVSKPKTAIEVLSQRTPAGHARGPEDRTFTMNQVSVFEHLEDMSDFMNSDTPFEIILEYKSATDESGKILTGATSKILTLKGVEFESLASSVDAGGSEFTLDFTGKFRTSLLTAGVGDSLSSTYNKTATSLSV